MDVWDIIPNKTKEIENNDTNTLSLTKEQQDLVLKTWNDNTISPPSISELIHLVFPEVKPDSRSKEGILIKKLLVSSGLVNGDAIKTQPSKNHAILTPSQKEYINNNYEEMKPIEMARTLFGMNISPASGEVKEIARLARQLYALSGTKLENIESYFAPSNVEKCVARIKKYVEETKDWNIKKLTAMQKIQAEALINYLSSFRVKYQIESYDKKEDKELFESSFIKYTYDKTDLTQENCDQYILLCHEIINDYHIQQNIRNLENEQNRIINEEGKISMAVVEALKSWGEKHDKSVSSQQKLYASLVEERSDRVSKELKDKSSLLNLINAWKNYETRQNILKLANEKKDKLRKDLHELENLDELKMRILGLSIDEVVNG